MGVEGVWGGSRRCAAIVRRDTVQPGGLHPTRSRPASETHLRRPGAPRHCCTGTALQSPRPRPHCRAAWPAHPLPGPHRIRTSRLAAAQRDLHPARLHPVRPPHIVLEVLGAAQQRGAPPQADADGAHQARLAGACRGARVRGREGAQHGRLSPMGRCISDLAGDQLPAHHWAPAPSSAWGRALSRHACRSVGSMGKAGP